MSWHVASLVVRCRPEAMASVQARLADLPSTAIRGAESGRLVLLVEGENEIQLADRFTLIRNTDGVLSADLVHHEIDTETDEAADVAHTP